MMEKKKKVLVGLSGGVDSAIAAYLLIEQGYDVSGLYMRNWDALANNDYLGNPTINDDQCPQEKDYEDALSAANSLQIPLLRCDFVDEYWNNVFQQFIQFYQLGLTPNPDVFCNKYIKFDAFLKYALEHGFDYIAMGHYARKVENIDGTFSLLKPFDKAKDQTYFLSQISQEQLKYALFPLDQIDKKAVRAMADKLNLTIATKKDSTGVCFIGERHFKEFLMNYVKPQKGKICDLNTNEVLGEHDGVNFYTIGQSKGLGIGGLKNIKSIGWIVAKKDIAKNILYVVPKDDIEDLRVDRVVVRSLSFINKEPMIGKVYTAQFRYRQAPFQLKIEAISANEMELVPVDPFYSVSPGQIAVLYDGEEVLGSGVIFETYIRGKRVN